MGTLHRVQDVGFSLIQLAYHLGLAVIVGGGLALGLVAAPAIFRAAKSRGDAGTIFGSVLARYDGIALVSVLAIWIAAYLRAANYETAETTHYVRWSALALMGLATVYASAYSNPVARSIRRQTPGFDDLRDDHPLRREFGALHRRSTRAMSLAIVLGIVALFLS